MADKRNPADSDAGVSAETDGEPIEDTAIRSLSKDEIKRLSIDETRRLVSYEPVDDGFEKYSVLTQ